LLWKSEVENGPNCRNQANCKEVTGQRLEKDIKTKWTGQNNTVRPAETDQLFQDTPSDNNEAKSVLMLTSFHGYIFEDKIGFDTNGHMNKS